MAIVMLDTIVNILEILLQMWYAFFKLKVRVHLHEFSKGVLVPIFSYSFFVFLISITDQINWKVDTTILGIMKGTAAVTLYSVAGQLITLYRTFCRRISGIFLPRVVKMVAKGADNHELTSVMIQVGRLQFMIIGLTWLGFAMIGKDFISVWMGTSYIEAYYLFLIISIPLIVPLCQSIGINILEAKNMNQFRAVTYLLIALSNIVISCVLVHFCGVAGAAMGTAIALILGETIAINWYYSKKVHLEIGRYFKEVFGAILPAQILAAVICAILLKIIPAESSWSGLLVRGFIIAVVYCFCIFLLAMNKQEKRQVLFWKKRFKMCIMTGYGVLARKNMDKMTQEIQSEQRRYIN